eukprot:TRINITY_DN1458_c0_g3_i1.p1 TRINITY_DN1458_c0_g3~~TRINITY_DN1458_c0_g3_i1.p1  ORF type:complete len:109 (+),score=16.60 TRINITY_DN1458_c0_g3_i1:232-558(+)
MQEFARSVNQKRRKSSLFFEFFFFFFFILDRLFFSRSFPTINLVFIITGSILCPTLQTRSLHFFFPLFFSFSFLDLSPFTFFFSPQATRLQRSQDNNKEHRILDSKEY